MIETEGVAGTKQPVVSAMGGNGSLLRWARSTLDPAMVVQLSRNSEGIETLRRMQQASRPFSPAYRMAIAPVVALLRGVEATLARSEGWRH